MSEPSDSVALEVRAACRHLVMQPLVLAEREPEAFRLVRRHEHQLDRWFTQRFGYRLQVTADTARLFKATYAPRRRHLQTATAQPRALSQRELLMLTLVLAAVAAGPDVISLRDLIPEIRSAAADGEITLTDEPADRRALVVALRWMIQHGLATELHDHIERYVEDDAADAILRIRPDRVALLPLPALARSTSVAELEDRSAEGTSTRAWMRCQLLEEPVLYRSDLDDADWAELRRRLSEEAATFAEMFGVDIEARAEGLAVIDPTGVLTDSAFPRGGTVGHAALLLLERMADTPGEPVGPADVVAIVGDLAASHRRYWSQLADDPEQLTDQVLTLLEDHRLVTRHGSLIEVLPAAWRYAVDEIAPDERDGSSPLQGALL